MAPQELVLEPEAHSVVITVNTAAAVTSGTAAIRVWVAIDGNGNARLTITGRRFAEPRREIDDLYAASKG